MNHNDTDSSPRPRRQRRSSWKIILVIAIIFIGVIALFFARQDQRFSLDQLLRQVKHFVLRTEQPSTPDSGKTPASIDRKLDGQKQEAGETTATAITEKAAPKGPDKELPADQQTASTQQDVCSQECAKIEAFYSHLDQQPYIMDFKLQQSSKNHFTGLFQKLAAQPPVVTRETDDLFTILKNTAHFFRVIGKDNIVLIKGILDRERESFEDVLASLFVLTSQPECLKNRLNLDIPATVYYEYSGFFLNTMGGRLYLFRRDSKSRMVVNYYAILFVDQANRAGTNRHGIDLRPSIAALIPEIENSGDQLKLKEKYLEQLYALQEKYPEAAEH